MNAKHVFLTLLLCSFAFVSLRGQSQSATQSHQDDDRLGPITDYDSATNHPTDAFGQAIHNERSRDYDVNTENLDEKHINNLPLKDSRWSLPLTDVYEEPLPVRKSDDIVIGTVTDAHSYLSNQKNAIYSEFKVEVQQILNGENVAVGETIEAQRAGGRVRLPSGKVVVDGWVHHTLPR